MDCQAVGGTRSVTSCEMSMRQCGTPRAKRWAWSSSATPFGRVRPCHPTATNPNDRMEQCASVALPTGCTNSALNTARKPRLERPLRRFFPENTAANGVGAKMLPKNFFFANPTPNSRGLLSRRFHTLVAGGTCTDAAPETVPSRVSPPTSQHTQFQPLLPRDLKQPGRKEGRKGDKSNY